jgi:hypothetical protein
MKEGATFSIPATQTYQTEAAATAIKYGEPVKLKTAGSEYVIPLADAEPVVGTTTFVAGIAATNSTQTSTADGTVEVFKPLNGAVYLATPKTASDIDTQAKYNALVNTPVLFDLTAGVYTVDVGATSATSGLVVCPLDISKYPGKVAFGIKEGATIFA